MVFQAVRIDVLPRRPETTFRETHLNSRGGGWVMDIFYFGLKALLLLTLARAYVVYEPLQRHWLFLSLLYTGGVAALNWALYLPLHPWRSENEWQLWLVKTFVLVVVYFKLLSKFDSGFLFWILLLGGWIGLVCF